MKTMNSMPVFRVHVLPVIWFTLKRWNLILTSYISLIKSRALSDTVEWMSTDWLAQYKTTSYALFIFGSFGLELTVENRALQTRFLKPVTEQNVKSNSNTWRKKMHESLRNAQAKKIWAATAWPSFNSMKHLGVLPLPPGWDASLHRVIKNPSSRDPKIRGEWQQPERPKRNRYNKQNNNFVRGFKTLFVLFFAITAQLPSENA